MDLKTLLQLPVFWRPERISKFWCELSEIIKQLKLKTELHDIDRDNLDMVCQSGNWMSYIGNPIQEYCNLRDKYADEREKDNYEVHSVIDLIRLYRNINTHKFSNYVKKYSEFKRTEKNTYNERSKEVRNLFKDGGVSYMLKKFPNLLLVSFDLGYQVCKLLQKSGVDTDFPSDYYISFVSLDADLLLPKTNDNFFSLFSEKLKVDSALVTDIWSYSVELAGKHIQFFKCGFGPKMQIGQQEICMMTYIEDNGIVTGFQILRVPVEQGDEDTPENPRDHRISKPNASSLGTLCFGLKTRSLKYLNVPVCIFGENLPAVLLRLLDQKDQTSFFIFTHLSHTEIQEITEQLAISKNFRPVSKEIEYVNLEPAYCAELLNKSMSLQKGSGLSFSLSDLKSEKPNVLEMLKGKILLNIIHSTVPDFLKTELPVLKDYISRRLISAVEENETIEEDDFVDWLDHDPQQQDNTLIMAVAGMGKSTLLVKIGHLLLEKNYIVRFVPARDLLKRIENSAKNSGTALFNAVGVIWSRVESEVLVYFLKQREGKKLKHKLFLLIDGIDELAHKTEQETVLNFVKGLQEAVKSSCVSTIITTRNAGQNVKVIRDAKLKNFSTFKIHEFDCPGDRKEYLLTQWRKYSKVLDDTIDHNATTCAKVSQGLGEFGGTAMAMVMLATAYKPFAKSNTRLKTENLKTAFELYDNFTEWILEENVIKCIQKPNVPKGTLFRRNTLNTKSLHLRLVKNLLIYVNARHAFSDVFCNQQKLLNMFDLAFCKVGISISNVNADPIIDSGLVHGVLKEYYVAIFVYELISAQSVARIEVTWNTHMHEFFAQELLAINKKTMDFTYLNIIRLVNSMLVKNETTRFILASVPEDFQLVSYCLIKHQFDSLFLFLLESVKDNKVIANCQYWKGLQKNNIESQLYHMFHYAIEKNLIEVTKFCILYIGLDVNHRDRLTSNNGLHCALNASLCDHYEMIKLLLESNADITETALNKSAFEIACSSTQINEKTFLLFAEYGDKNIFQENRQAWKKLVEGENGENGSTTIAKFGGLFEVQNVSRTT